MNRTEIVKEMNFMIRDLDAIMRSEYILSHDEYEPILYRIGELLAEATTALEEETED